MRKAATMAGPVLVPMTLSNVTAPKLNAATAQARALAADVLLLHVLDGRNGVPDHGLVTAEEARARTHLDTAAATVRDRGVQARSLVRTGPIGQAVRLTALQHEASLIVLGSTPSSGVLQRLVSKTRGTEIARTAPCPVLIVGQDQAGQEQHEQHGQHGRGPRHRAEPGAHRDTATALRRFDRDAAQVGPLAPHAVGTRTVELSRIVGSVPALRLGLDFRPSHRRREEDERHAQLTKQMAERPERVVPPELYKLGYGYYVFDGHPYVAAALANGHTWIDATVTEYVPVRDATASQVAAERAQFERETGLTGIGAALPGTYGALKAMVHEFGAGADLQLSATRWKAAIFRPLQRRLREFRLNHYFPGERSADIVKRIASHRQAEAHRRRRDVYWEEALASFAALAPFSPGAPKAANEHAAA